MTQTVLALSAKWIAAVRPAMPAPMIRTSNSCRFPVAMGFMIA